MSGVMKSAADAWTISMTDKRALQIVGPNGPCRYALFTNIPEDVDDPKERYGVHPLPSLSLMHACGTYWGGGMQFECSVAADKFGLFIIY